MGDYPTIRNFFVSIQYSKENLKSPQTMENWPGWLETALYGKILKPKLHVLVFKSYLGRYRI